MPKVIVYGYRISNASLYERFAAEMGFEMVTVNETLDENNVNAAEGIELATIIPGCKGTAPVLRKLKEAGCHYLVARAIGYDNIDLDAASRLGIKVSNIVYSPNSVSEFAVMLGLALNRNFLYSQRLVAANRYRFVGLEGVEVRNQIVGIIGGTGRIGSLVAQAYRGLGARVLYTGRRVSEAAEAFGAERVEEADLFALSDLISIHAPLNESTHGLIRSETIEAMKDGVRIVNVARGEIVKTSDLIEGLKSGKVAGFAADVLEGERAVFFTDHGMRAFDHDEAAILKSFNNVILTPHYAFLTDQALTDMVENTFKSLRQFYETGTSEWQLN